MNSGFQVPDGKFSLVGGYANTPQFVAPYRGVRYHLKEFGCGHRRPRDYKELFNHRHSILRNHVERALGVLKKRFPILKVVMMFGRLSPKASLLQQQQRHLQKKHYPASTLGVVVSTKEAQQLRASWNPGLEKALVDLLHEHNNPHYPCQNGWTGEAWNKFIKKFHNRHPYVTMNKQQIQDKEKQLKRDYRLLNEARKQSGASWDNQRCRLLLLMLFGQT
uniref:Myb/SANT-like domain-containing protein n=1 Tax=Oryza meridionalis TaxID=40149 RepID=A0A0E0DBT0_9ORYZ